MSRTKYWLIFLPDYQPFQRNMSFVNIKNTIEAWYHSDCITDCRRGGGGGEVKQIKVISDKNVITQSNFEQAVCHETERRLEIR